MKRILGSDLPLINKLLRAYIFHRDNGAWYEARKRAETLRSRWGIDVGHPVQEEG